MCPLDAQDAIFARSCQESRGGADLATQIGTPYAQKHHALGQQARTGKGCLRISP